MPTEPPPAPRPDTGAARVSRITDGTRLLHGDLHNHSLLSDGAGDPDRAFALMRAAGLDVAALTDHASIPHHALDGLDPGAYPDDAAYRLALTAPHSLGDEGWRRARDLADAADEPGTFTAIRGFEWTEPWLGHSNVWFSQDALHVDTPGDVSGLHAWLERTEPGALFGYNHPGREPGRFGEFAVAPALVPRMVGLEAFNRVDDYLFEGWSRGRRSPIAACLDAGWRPGLLGVSDEHGRSYGLAGKGRTGIWAPEHSRAGVREALLARRTFATREVGLRLDATLGGARMGQPRPAGRAELAVDLDGGPGWSGRPVELQLLTSGADGVPQVRARVPATVGEPVRTDVDPPVDGWVLLRVADPSRRNATPGPPGHPGNAYGVAYASPWWSPGS